MKTSVYVVRHGDYLAKIAREHATTVAAIWNHPGNSEIRTKRGSPNVLLPGDLLVIPTDTVHNSAPEGDSPLPTWEQPTATSSTDHWPYPPARFRRVVPSWTCPDGLCACSGEVPTPRLAFAVLVHDQHGARMPGAICRVVAAGQTERAAVLSSDKHGWLVVEVANPHLDEVLIEWAPGVAPSSSPLPYRCIYHIALGDDQRDQTLARLANLGFRNGRSLEANVRNFEMHYGFPVSGRLESIEEPLGWYHDRGQLPERRVPGAPPEAPLPPAHPPAPPDMSGREPLGGGTMPGRGAIRAEFVHRTVRLLDMYEAPARGAACRVRVGGWEQHATSNEAGIVDLAVPVDAEELNVEWDLASHNMAQHRVRLWRAEPALTIGERLENLGLLQPSQDEQLATFRLEKEYSPTIPDAVVESDICAWHDTGHRPGTSDFDERSDAPLMEEQRDFLIAEGKVGDSRVPNVFKRRYATSTACPKPTVNLFRDRHGRRAPHKQYKSYDKHARKPDKLWQLELWKGQHSAIVLPDFPKNAYPVHRSPDGAVPGPDHPSWFDVMDGGTRYLFFHGWRNADKVDPKDPNSLEKESACRMFEIRPRCAFFQVWTRSYPTSSRIWVELHGDALCLNAPDAEVGKYDLGASVVVPFDTDPGAVVNMVLARAPVDHLVFNAHGTMPTDFLVAKRTELLIAGKKSNARFYYDHGVDRDNLDVFERLRGKVRYIWIQGCFVGAQREFGGRVAQLTGAWVIAYRNACPVPSRARKGCIDWLQAAHMVVWKHSLAAAVPGAKGTRKEFAPVHAWKMFAAARRYATPNRFEDGLDFNVVAVDGWRP